LIRHALPELKVSSAGLGALVGYGADPIAVQLMAEAGIDISSHRARMLTEEIAREADLILVMDDTQKMHIGMQYPFVFDKIYKLGEASNKDIPDPYRQDPEVFRTVFSMIQGGVNEWVECINDLGDEPA
jgi:low molecular weight protein-tyrosine phosphatase